MKRGKKHREAIKQYDAQNYYALNEAVSIVKKVAYARFDETVEIALELNVKKGNTIRDTFVLPHQFSAEKRILVLAKDAKAEEARSAGAMYVGAEEYIEKIKNGWFDFDVIVATPDMMKDVGRLGAVLGRRGLMPNPKSGTVTMNVADSVNELKKGRIEFRTDKFGVLHLAVGKVSMTEEQLRENVSMLLTEVMRKKPSDTKGEFVKGIAISSTMGPGVKVVREV